jgi:hypothetical protein
VFEKIKESIKQDYYVQNFPNDGQRFVAWYLRNVHLRDQNEAKAEIRWWVSSVAKCQIPWAFVQVAPQNPRENRGWQRC